MQREYGGLVGPVANALTIPRGSRTPRCRGSSSLALIAEDGATSRTASSATGAFRGPGAPLAGIDAGDRVRVVAAAAELGRLGGRVAATAMAGAVLVPPQHTLAHLAEVLDVVDRAGLRLWLAQDGFLGTPMAGPGDDAWGGDVVACRAGGRAGCRRARRGPTCSTGPAVVGHRVGRASPPR